MKPGIGFSTVHRGLVRLRGQGLVAEVVVPGSNSGSVTFAGRCPRCR